MISKTMLAAALTASAGLAACGNSGTSSTTAKPAPGPAAGAAATTTAPPPATSATSAGITFVATEYAFAPSALTAKAGKVTMTLENKGKIPHELILLKTNQAANALKTRSASGKVSESASVGEVSELAAGKSAAHTFNLTPGKYVFICNIPAHYKLGMRGTLTVE